MTLIGFCDKTDQVFKSGMHNSFGWNYNLYNDILVFSIPMRNNPLINGWLKDNNEKRHTIVVCPSDNFPIFTYFSYVIFFMIKSN